MFPFQPTLYVTTFGKLILYFLPNGIYFTTMVSKHLIFNSFNLNQIIKFDAQVVIKFVPTQPATIFELYLHLQALVIIYI